MGRAGDDVLVGEDVTLGIDDEPRALAPAHAVGIGVVVRSSLGVRIRVRVTPRGDGGARGGLLDRAFHHRDVDDGGVDALDDVDEAGGAACPPQAAVDGADHAPPPARTRSRPATPATSAKESKRGARHPEVSIDRRDSVASQPLASSPR
jgi:hypothetical protein